MNELDTGQNLNPNPFYKVFGTIKKGLANAANWRTVVVWISSAVLVSYTGPFGTYQSNPILVQIPRWLILLGGAIVIAYVIQALCHVFIPRRPKYLNKLVFTLVGSLAIGLFVDLMLSNVFDKSAADKPPLLQIVFYSFCIVSFVQIVREVSFGHEDSTDPKTTDRHARRQGQSSFGLLPEHSQLARRLNIPQDAQIFHVSANGHFVEVSTCAGNFRARMRFSDAIAELDESAGLTVHRSHWVLRDAITGWQPDAKKPFVQLKDETRVPVSKTYFDDVAEADLPIASAS